MYATWKSVSGKSWYWRVQYSVCCAKFLWWALCLCIHQKLVNLFVNIYTCILTYIINFLLPNLQTFYEVRSSMFSAQRTTLCFPSRNWVADLILNIPFYIRECFRLTDFWVIYSYGENRYKFYLNSHKTGTVFGRYWPDIPCAKLNRTKYLRNETYVLTGIRTILLSFCEFYTKDLYRQ
jgi:hypothetical protein